MFISLVVMVYKHPYIFSLQYIKVNFIEHIVQLTVDGCTFKGPNTRQRTQQKNYTKRKVVQQDIYAGRMAMGNVRRSPVRRFCGAAIYIYI